MSKLLKQLNYTSSDVLQLEKCSLLKKNTKKIGALIFLLCLFHNEF